LRSPYYPCRTLTIQEINESPEHQGLTPETLALAALGWLLGDQPRADRLLSLTGLTPDILRDGLGERSVQAAVLEFLTNHEPDLIAAADALSVRPEDLAAAHERLNR